MISITNPYTKKTIAKIAKHSANEIETFIKNGVTAKAQMKALQAFERAEILTNIQMLLTKHKEEFVSTIISESGKPRIYAIGEVNRAIETFKCASEEAKRIPAELLDLAWTARAKNKTGEIHYTPCGLVLGISPFNFPLNLVAHKVAPAIAAGCPIILKPSSKTPLTTLLLKKIIDKTTLPKNAFQVVICSRENGNILIQDDRISVLSFTGSPEIGWKMKTEANKKRVVLELGGNAGAIICSDANIEDAVNKLIIGGYAYSGQVCIHTQRIYVHHSKFDEFKALFTKAIKNIKIGNPDKKKTQFSVMIDNANAVRVEKWINEAKKNGAKIIYGGNRTENFLEPTLITSTAKGMKVRDEEIFGPVVCLESYKNLNDAIYQINDSRWGLQNAIFTDSINNVNKAFELIEAGGLIHNDATTFRVDHMPYGGIKDSGFGREGVKYAMLDYLEPKLLVKQR